MAQLDLCEMFEETTTTSAWRQCYKLYDGLLDKGWPEAADVHDEATYASTNAPAQMKLASSASGVNVQHDCNRWVRTELCKRKDLHYGPHPRKRC